MTVVLLIALLSVSGCGGSRVVGQTGQSVTLPCTYNIKHHGALSVCWGRGELPISGCSNQLLATDGSKVKEETRASSRFQLLGRLDEGDVSLTILNLTEEDAGPYGCRVEIPGLGNDQKNHVDLTVEGAPSSPPAPSASQPPSESPAAAQTTAGQTSSEDLLTSSSDGSVSGEDQQQEGSLLTVVLVAVLFLLVVLVTAAALVIMARRWKQLKLPQQQVHFNPTSSTLQLQHRDSAEDNIYQMDGGAEGGDYEFCP